MNESESKKLQFSTFEVAGRTYGIEVTVVQEIVKEIPMTRIPLSRSFVRGLINLRGQVVTAICLQDLFEIEDNGTHKKMNVICKCDDSLVSLLVDEIGDVIEVESSSFEPPPATIPGTVKRFISGVYKQEDCLLSIIDIEKIGEVLNHSQDQAA